MRRFVILAAIQLASLRAAPASAAPLVTVAQTSETTSDITVEDTYDTCASFPARIDIEQFTVEHPRRFVPRLGRLEVRVGDFGAIGFCHVLGQPRVVATTFHLDTLPLPATGAPLNLVRASTYLLVINGTVVGEIETGLLGDHEVRLSSSSAETLQIPVASGDNSCERWCYVHSIDDPSYCIEQRCR